MVSPEALTSVVIGVVSFAGGFISGYLFRDMRLSINKDRDNGSMVLTVVTIVWAISVLVDIISPTYETSPLIHGLMGAIVGFFYRPFGKGDQKV